MKFSTIFGFFGLLMFFYSASLFYRSGSSLLNKIALSKNGGVYEEVINIIHLPAGKYLTLKGVDKGPSTANRLYHKMVYTVQDMNTGRVFVIEENSPVHIPYFDDSVITVTGPGEFEVCANR